MGPSGFTLVELIVVVLLVTLLFAITVPIFSTSGKRVNRETCLNNLFVIGRDLAQYRQDYGAFPAAPLPDYLLTLDPTYVPFGLLPVQSRVLAAPGTTPDDLTPVGVYTGDDPGYQVKVKIARTGTSASDPDEFLWSDRGDDGWAGPVPITAPAAPITIKNGIGVRFATNYGHASVSVWTIALAPDVPQEWKQWRQAPAVETAAEILEADDTTTGGGAVQVADTAWLDFLDVNSPVIIRSGDSEELVLVKSVQSDGFTTHADLERGYPAGSTILPGFATFIADGGDPADVHYDGNMIARFVRKNYGLFRLLQTYALPLPTFHCPEISETADVIQGANLRASGDDPSQPRRVDSLKSGYNTYDSTYNYDQYHNAILRFDALLGYGDIDSARQLKNPNAPADTVVTWCYGHRLDATPSYPLGDPAQPDMLGTPYTPGDTAEEAAAERANARAVQNYTRKIADNQALILWQDGTVRAVGPRLARSKYDRADGARRRACYYLVPPFLLTTGDEQP